MKKLLFAVGRDWHKRMFSQKDLARIQAVCRVLAVDVPDSADKQFLLEHVKETEIVVTSWNTAALDAEVMSRAAELQLLAHAGGSVRTVVSDALWARGVRVTGSAAAIACGVAEFCLCQMVIAGRRVFWAGLGTRMGLWRESLNVFGGPFDIYRQKVGIIGGGYVGKHLIGLLKNFGCDICLYDPFVSADAADKMGVKKIEKLEDIFSQCKVVSLNVPLTNETRHMIGRRHFELLPEGAVFINTSRGALVNEDELVAELRKGRFVACIDVTDGEPPPPDHPFRNLPNVWLTPHQAGGIGRNLLRIGALVADEIEAFTSGWPLRFEVERQHLGRIA
jgi:phosphoglycerate dehydrogenase-like enzyme